MRFDKILTFLIISLFSTKLNSQSNQITKTAQKPNIILLSKQKKKISRIHKHEHNHYSNKRSCKRLKTDKPIIHKCLYSSSKIWKGVHNIQSRNGKNTKTNNFQRLKTRFFIPELPWNYEKEPQKNQFTGKLIDCLTYTGKIKTEQKNWRKSKQ